MAISERGAAHVQEAMAGFVERGEVAGLAWLVSRGGQPRAGAAGTTTEGGGTAVTPDTIFRISSMTKPITAFAALALVTDGLIGLDDPVEGFLPELDGLRVLSAPDAPLDATEPLRRPVTLRDLLTFRLGWGMDFTNWAPTPLAEAWAELGLGAGPPAPDARPPAEEWLARMASLPLQYQPGERWLYHTSAEVLGVVVGRVAGTSLAEVLRARVFEPLGMVDTGFWVPPAKLGRFGDCYTGSPRRRYDAVDGQWSHEPAFFGGGDGLVSTVGDYWAFSEALRARGRGLVAPELVDAMVTDQLSAEQRRLAGIDGWGFGVGVGVGGRPGRYGWDGGLGSTWATDPATDLTGILLTNQTFDSPGPPPVVTAFWAAVEEAAAEG